MPDTHAHTSTTDTVSNACTTDAVPHAVANARRWRPVAKCNRHSALNVQQVALEHSKKDGVCKRKCLQMQR
jgi:hypothetical protein